MTVIKSIVLLLVLAISAIAANECTISLLQEKRSTWTSDTGVHSLFDVHILNTGNAIVPQVTLNVESQFESVWELLSVGDGKYELPTWRVQHGGIPAGAFHQFGYVATSDSALNINVAGCENIPTLSPSTDAPVAQPTDAPTTPATAAPAPATVAPTDAPTAAPTQRPSRLPSSAATTRPVDPTRAPTAQPTDKPATASPTRKPATASPTAPATAAPTSKPATAAPTSKAATTAPTSKPATTAPTSKPATTAPTSKPATAAPTTSGSSGDQVCQSGSWWRPAPLTTWQWQITGTVDTSVNVQMYDIDLFSATSTLIKTLHTQGRVVVCYFSTQYEDWRPDASQFTSAVIGKPLDGWDGENYVDIRSSLVRNIMAARLDLAVSKGCDGVEPDNVDGYTASTGFPITAANQLDYNKFLASEAHKRGLSIGLKNDLDQAAALEPFFDWALNEQCYQYSECDTLSVFVNAGKAVFNAEYQGTASKFCPAMNNLKISALLKDLNLGASIKAQCCTYLSGGCTPAASTCVSSSSSLIPQDSAAEAPAVAQQPIQADHVSSAVSVFYSATVLLAAVLCGLIML